MWRPLSGRPCAEEEEVGGDGESDDDEDNVRNLDSHDRLANRLKTENMAWRSLS
jgi:hypothetical protein